MEPNQARRAASRDCAVPRRLLSVLARSTYPTLATRSAACHEPGIRSPRSPLVQRIALFLNRRR